MAHILCPGLATNMSLQPSFCRVEHSSYLLLSAESIAAHGGSFTMRLDRCHRSEKAHCARLCASQCGPTTVRPAAEPLDLASSQTALAEVSAAFTFFVVGAAANGEADWFVVVVVGR